MPAPVLSCRADRIRFVRFMQHRLERFSRPPEEITIEMIETAAGWRMRRRIKLFHSAYVRGRVAAGARPRLIRLLSGRFSRALETDSGSVGFEILSPIVPGDANKVPERKTPRLTPEEPIPARFAGYEVLIRDFSSGGFRVEHGSPILLDTQGRLEFTLPRSSERIEAEGRSTWTRIVSFGKDRVIFQSGIELAESSATLDQLIARLESIFLDEPILSDDQSDHQIESRRAPRLVIQTPIRGRFGSMLVTIRDISTEGVRIEHEHTLMLSTRAPLVLRLPSFQTICVSAEIVWSRYRPGFDGSGPAYQSGIRVDFGKERLAEAFNRILGSDSGYYDSVSLQTKRAILRHRAHRRSISSAELSSTSNAFAVVRIVRFVDQTGLAGMASAPGQHTDTYLDQFRQLLRLGKSRSIRLPKLPERKRNGAFAWSAAAVLTCAILGLPVAFRDHPSDPSYIGTLELLRAYESRTPEEMRDYGQPLYRSALAMLERVDPNSRSASDAKLLAAQLWARIDEFNRRNQSEARRLESRQQRAGNRDDAFLQSIGSANPGTAHAPAPPPQAPDREQLARQAEMIRQQARQQ